MLKNNSKNSTNAHTMDPQSISDASAKRKPYKSRHKTQWYLIAL